MNGIARTHQNAERYAQARQRRLRYMDYSLRGLRPRYLQRKAQEYSMEHPNATWNDYSTHINQKDVRFQVASNFLNDEEQTKAELATLGPEMKNLRTELQEHRNNAVEGTSKPVDPTKKEDKKLPCFVIIAAQMDTPPVGVERKYETKN